MNTMKSNCILLTTTLLLFTISSFAQGDAYMMLGNESFKKKEYTRAIEMYDKCIEANPKHTGCLFNRGLTRSLAVSYASAVEDFTAVIAIQPTHAKAFEHRGSSYASMNRETEALQDFNRSLELNPRSAGALWSRGLLFKKKKDTTRAIADFTKMIEVAPNDDRGYSYRADTYRDLKEYDKAISDYTQTIQRNPSHASALYYRGLIYHEQGKTDLAEADFARASALDKNYESLVRGMKTLAKSKEISEQTRKILENAKQPNPPAATPDVNSNGAYGLWQATLHFGAASKTYALFLEPADVQSPSVLFIANADRYELKNLKLTDTGVISFYLVMGKTPVAFSGKIEAGGQKITGQFSYSQEGKTTIEKWSAERQQQK